MDEGAAGAPPDSLIVTDAVTRCALPLCLFTICNLCPLAVAVLLLPEGYSRLSRGGGEFPARLAQGGVFAAVGAATDGTARVGDGTGLALAPYPRAGGAGGSGRVRHGWIGWCARLSAINIMDSV